MNVREGYIRWHALRTFFEDLTLWREARDWVGLAGEISREEYDRLLKGTEAEA